MSRDIFSRRGRWNQNPPIIDYIDASGDCWEWTGARNNHRGGYGMINIDGRPHQAHRVIWEALVGPIPKRLQLDHLCRNPPCVNPDHLEPVTNKENGDRGHRVNPIADANRARTHCPQGHPYSGDNLYVAPVTERRKNGFRGCRACRSTAKKKSILKQKAGQ